MMRAVWYDRQGPASEVLVCGELPTPEPGSCSYCVINFLPDSTRVCHAWRFSLMEAGCGSRIRQTRQRITVRSLCRGIDDSARTCRPGGALPILLHRFVASRPAEKR